MVVTDVLDAIVERLQSLRGAELPSFLQLTGPIEWDSFPSDEEDIAVVLEFFYSYMKGIVVSYVGAEHEPSADEGSGVISHYQKKATLTTVCVYDRVRSLKEGTLAVRAMAELVAGQLNGWPVDDEALPITPLVMGNESELFSTRKAIGWIQEWRTQFLYAP